MHRRAQLIPLVAVKNTLLERFPQHANRTVPSPLGEYGRAKKNSRQTESGATLLAGEMVLPVTKAAETHDGQDHDLIGRSNHQGHCVTLQSDSPPGAEKTFSVSIRARLR